MQCPHKFSNIVAGWLGCSSTTCTHEQKFRNKDHNRPRVHRHTSQGPHTRHRQRDLHRVQSRTFRLDRSDAHDTSRHPPPISQAHFLCMHSWTEGSERDSFVAAVFCREQRQAEFGGESIVYGGDYQHLFLSKRRRRCRTTKTCDYDKILSKIQELILITRHIQQKNKFTPRKHDY